jgi:hypothetical protein
MEERKAQAEVLRAEADMGIASQIDVIRGLHPEIENDEEALERLLRVKQIEKDLASFDQIPDLPDDDVEDQAADEAEEEQVEPVETEDAPLPEEG